MRQYEDERDGRDLLFAFQKRALVHFAVDPDEVWMTTRLKGKETDFLPFNRGNNHGAGNPPVEGNWKNPLPVGRGPAGRQTPGNPATLHASRSEGKTGQDRQGRAHRAEGDDDFSRATTSSTWFGNLSRTPRSTVQAGTT